MHCCTADGIVFVAKKKAKFFNKYPTENLQRRFLPTLSKSGEKGPRFRNADQYSFSLNNLQRLMRFRSGDRKQQSESQFNSIVFVCPDPRSTLTIMGHCQGCPMGWRTVQHFQNKIGIFEWPSVPHRTASGRRGMFSNKATTFFFCCGHSMARGGGGPAHYWS